MMNSTIRRIKAEMNLPLSRKFNLVSFADWQMLKKVLSRPQVLAWRV